MHQYGVARLLLRLADGGRWMSMGACRSADPDLFFPVSASAGNRAQVAEARAVCASCLVRHQCLRFSIQTGQLYGIWGGMTEEERYPAIRRSSRPFRPPARPGRLDDQQAGD
jgi:WhiB family redox-sensing transcriptional regulator